MYTYSVIIVYEYNNSIMGRWETLAYSRLPRDWIHLAPVYQINRPESKRSLLFFILSFYLDLFI